MDLHILRLLAASLALVQVLILVPGFSHGQSPRLQDLVIEKAEVTPSTPALNETTLIRGHLHIDRMGRLWKA